MTGRRYDEVVGDLRRAYDGAVDRRAAMRVEPWKAAEREAFLALLRREERRSLLEIGAGTGVHGRFFADHGLDVVCTDLSPAMVAHCRGMGLVAFERDFLHLDLGRTFDAAFAMNCLLHVPREDLPSALAEVRSVLAPGAPCYLGQYGGVRRDGPWSGDEYRPARYFSWLPDDELVDLAGGVLAVESFHAVDVGWDDGAHFQSLLLRA